MYFAIIGVVCGLIGGLIFVYCKNKNEKLRVSPLDISYCILGSFVGVFLVTLLGLVSIGDGANAPRHIDYTENVALVSLRNDHLVQGDFFLGNGTINEELYYFYYQDLGNNSYALEKKLANNAIIVEEDRSDGLLQISTYVINESWKGWILFNDEPSYSYEFHVPKGSIQRNFVLQ